MNNDRKKVKNFLDYFSIIKYALEHISTVKTIDEVTAHFHNSIEDITSEDESHLAQLAAMNIPGHENYLFKFKEDNNLFGEFSIDIIPIDPAQFAINGIRNLGKDLPESKVDEKQLANFRVQLFADGLFSSQKLSSTYKTISDYIIKKYGLPNQPHIAKENCELLKDVYGTDIDCWHFQENDRDYLITFYLFNGKAIRGYISFSVALLINKTN